MATPVPVTRHLLDSRSSHNEISRGAGNAPLVACMSGSASPSRAAHAGSYSDTALFCRLVFEYGFHALFESQLMGLCRCNRSHDKGKRQARHHDPCTSEPHRPDSGGQNGCSQQDQQDGCASAHSRTTNRIHRVLREREARWLRLMAGSCALRACSVNGFTNRAGRRARHRGVSHVRGSGDRASPIRRVPNRLSSCVRRFFRRRGLSGY